MGYRYDADAFAAAGVELGALDVLGFEVAAAGVDDPDPDPEPDPEPESDFTAAAPDVSPDFVVALSLDDFVCRESLR